MIFCFGTEFVLWAYCVSSFFDNRASYEDAHVQQGAEAWAGSGRREENS
jgi:hypothetical protein